MGFGIGPPGMCQPLGGYNICTNCGSLRGWLLVIPKPTTLDDYMIRISDPDRVVLCTKCSHGKISGIDAEWIKKNEPKIVPFWKYLKDESFEIKQIEITGVEGVEYETGVESDDDRGLSPYGFNVSINGEPVDRLSQLDLCVWIGEPEPGVTLTLTFGIPVFEGDVLKEIRKETFKLDISKIKGFTFDLVKFDDHGNE